MRAKTTFLRKLVLCAALAVSAVPVAVSAPNDPPPERVTVVAAPIGRFGFSTGSGGMLWTSAINRLVVLKIQAGGPAEKAGMRVGDEILEVDGMKVPGQSRREVFQTLRNKDAGKPVVFKVVSDKGKGPAREVRIVPVDPDKERR